MRRDPALRRIGVCDLGDGRPSSGIMIAGYHLCEVCVATVTAIAADAGTRVFTIPTPRKKLLKRNRRNFTSDSYTRRSAAR